MKEAKKQNQISKTTTSQTTTVGAGLASAQRISAKGITLIALVITIIVLLILASVAINLTLGDNGIFKKAKQAKADTIIAQAREKIRLASNSAVIEGTGDITYSNLVKELNNEFNGQGSEVGQYEILGNATDKEWTIIAHTSVGDVTEIIKGVAEQIPESQTATFIPGGDFNNKAKILANGDLNNVKEIKEIKTIEATNKEEKNLASIETSPNPIYIYFDETEETLYFYTEAKKIYLNEDCYNMFGSFGFSNILELAKFDSSKVEDMFLMIQKCKSLTSLDGIEDWDTSRVKDMCALFWGDEKLEDIDAISNWNLTSVSDLSQMLQWTGVTNLNALRNWNVGKVEEFGAMFIDCYSLTDITGISNWNMESAKGMWEMFGFCKKLSDIEPLRNWKFPNCTDIAGIFEQCHALKDISPLANWDVSNVEDFGWTFCECKVLKDITPIKDWDLSGAKTVEAMFIKCTEIEDFSPINNWNITNVTKFYQMCKECNDKHPEFTKRAGTWNTEGTFIPE